MPSKKRAPTLNPSQLRHVLNVTQATSRMIFLTSPKISQALAAYLDYRVFNCLGCALTLTEYHGLLPSSKLLLRLSGGFLWNHWQGLRRNWWRVSSVIGGGFHWNTQLRIKTSSHAGRRSFDFTSYAKDLSWNRLQYYLATSVDVTADYIQEDKNRLREMYEVVLSYSMSI